MSANTSQQTRYRLISLGKLKPGVKEADALPKLQALTKLDELMARKKLLAGKKVSLLTTNDVTRLATLKGKFSAVGLMVEVMEIPPEPTPEPESNTTSLKDKLLRYSKRLAWTAAALIVLFLAAGAGLWFWLFQPVDDPTLTAESALVNDRTAAIAHINMTQADKLFQLTRMSLADLMSDANGQLPPPIAVLASPELSVNHLFSAVLAVPGSDEVDVLAVATGEFSAGTLQATLKNYYQLDTLENGRWQLSTRLITDTETCPAEAEPATQPLFAQAQDNLLVVSTSPSALDRFEQNQTSSNVSTSLSQWRTYRDNKLASAMVFSPQQGTAALPGLAGMVGSQVVASVPQLQNTALSAEVDLIARGIRFNGQLGSSDEGWNAQMTMQANQWLNATRTNSNITSPTAADLLAGITVRHDSSAINLDWPITAGNLTQLRRSVENTLASTMGGSMSFGQDQEVRIQEEPVNYQYGFQLANLPAMDLSSANNEPLFHQGPVTVDFSQLDMNDDGFLELAIEAKAAMPEGADDNTLRALLQQQLRITDVQNDNGESLLRDERCTDRSDFFGRSRNHEAEQQGSVFFGAASISKQVRLLENTAVADIHQIQAQYTLTRPTGVQVISVPLVAGEQVTLGDTTFDLVSIGERSVRYRITGNESKLLGVRAKQADGQVLQSSWKSSFGRLNDQHFYGPVSQLEVILASDFESRTINAQLSNLFAPNPETEQPATPFALSYAPVDRAKWNRYQFVDMRLLRPNPEDWRYTSNNATTVGQTSWPGLKLVMTHSSSGWNGNPTAHLYMPLFKELLGSMSALSYRLTNNEDAQEKYVPLGFSYRPEDLTLIPQQTVQNQPFGLTHFTVDTGQDSGSEFAGAQGVLSLRMPQKIQSLNLDLNDLWRGQSIEGIKVTLDAVNRGMFPGYSLRLEGALENLIGIHGIDERGQRVIPTTRNYQSGGYWTATIPFRNNMRSVQLVTAQEQDVFELPFNFR